MSGFAPGRRQVPLGDDLLEQCLRETIARGVYDARPYRTARCGGVMEMMVAEGDTAWDAAPPWYRAECYEIADSVLARMLLDREAGEAVQLDLIAAAARRAA